MKNVRKQRHSERLVVIKVVEEEAGHNQRMWKKLLERFSLDEIIGEIKKTVKFQIRYIDLWLGSNVI